MSEKLGVSSIQRSRLSEQIVIQLCQMIGHGRLRPGDRLPSERSLADQLQVSRTSLREALRMLELSGIVTIRQGGGTFVREFADDGLLSPLMLMLDGHGELVGDLIEARLIFEPETAARAAVRANGENLAELERIVQAQRKSVDQRAPDDGWLLLDREFHIAIARASHNEVAVRLTRVITEMLQEARRHFIASDQRVQQALARHLEILRAIQRADPQHARDAMLGHLRDVEAFVLDGVVSRDAGVPDPPLRRSVSG